MSSIDPTTRNALLVTVTNIEKELERIRRILNDVPTTEENFDFDDPRNKRGVNLTERGAEIVYRLFDQGKTRNYVKDRMKIAFGSANERYAKWLALGGPNREKQPLA